jgi:hypothetical protein
MTADVGIQVVDGKVLRSVTIEIWLPPQSVAQNFHGKRREHFSGKKAYRTHARDEVLAQAHRFQFKKPVVLRHEWYMGKERKEELGLIPKRYRPLDVGNAIGALKAAIDGLCDAGLLVSDSHDRLKWGECELYRTAKEHGGRSCVVLTFTEVA